MSSVGKSVWRMALRLLVFAIVCFVLWTFGADIWHLFSPFLLAIPVAIALQKPIRFFEKKLRLKHGIAVGIWVLIVCLVIVAILYWLLSTVINQIIMLSTNYQTIISDFISMLRGVANQILDALDYMSPAAEDWMRATLNETFATLSTTATRWLGAIFNAAVSFASSIPYALIYLNFLLLGIFFITSAYPRLRENVFSKMGDDVRSRSEMLSGTAGHGLAGYIKVQALYAALVFVISLPCLSLFGLPYAVLIAAIATILEFLPIFGNGTLYIPFAIVCYIIGNPTLGTEMLVLHLALYIFRRVTEPKLMSNQMGLSTLLSLVSMFVGMQVGGVLGLILAPVVVVVMQGAWHGGLFTATMADVRCLISYVRTSLGEPPPCETEDNEEKPPNGEAGIEEQADVQATDESKVE